MKSPWGICPRCGFKVRLSALRREWTGLRVCGKCHDPRPPDTKPPKVGPEGVPVKGASPEPPIIYREEGDMGGDDL
jgi:hypothetical protein